MMSPTEFTHERITRLLPWYVNGTLGAAERENVDWHLGACTECREAITVLESMAAAIDRDPLAPIVPKADPSRVFERIDAESGGGRNRETTRRAPKIAIAASVLVAVLAGIAYLVTTPPGNDLFRTATAPQSPRMMNYVLELRFVDGTDAGERERLLREIGATNVAEPEPGKYVGTVSLDVESLADLRLYTNGLASNPDVESASIVAMQIPIEGQE